MRNMKRTFALLLTLVMVFSLTLMSAVFAAGGNGKGSDKPKTTETGKDNGNGKGNAIENNTQTQETTTEGTVEETKEQKAVKEKDKVMDIKNELKQQLLEAQKSGNAALAQQITAQMVQVKEQLKEMVKSGYTEEELNQLQLAVQNALQADPTLQAAPVESLIAKGKSLKLDIPPVIKDGKMLVPVRAFSQAFGAEVEWNAEDHTVTIVKDGVEIVIKTDSNIVLVNGVETDLGMPVKAINGRNVLPVGFLAEKLGLKVEEDEDGTVEVGEDEGDTTTGDTTTNTTTGN